MIVSIKIAAVIVLTAICMSIYSFYTKVRENKKSKIAKYIIYFILLSVIIICKVINPEYKIFLIMFLVLADIALIEIADAIAKTDLESEIHNLVKTFAKMILTITILVVTLILFVTIIFNS